MGDKESYYGRLWHLLDLARSRGVSHLAESLLAVLETDFAKDKQHFSESEYRDPPFREALLGILLQSGTVVYFPTELVALVRQILGDGKILSLYSGLGEFLTEFGGGVGVEPNALAARWSKFLLAIGGVEAEIIQADPRYWESEDSFDRIVCNTPFGHKQDHAELLTLVMARLSADGQLALLVPPAFMWGERYKWYRESLSSHSGVRAIISLPPRLFAKTSVQTALLVLQHDATGKTYMATSRSAADLAAIGEDYRAWRAGRKPTIGFPSDLTSDTWDVRRYEPIDFGLNAVSFSYRVIPLAEVASLKHGVLTTEARVAVNRTGSKVLWLDGETDLTEQNNIFVEPSAAINPMYLYLYLSSSIGKRALGRLIKGETVPYVSVKDLQSLPVVLPDASQQSRIVDQALEIKKSVSTLEALSFEAKQSLSDSFFDLESTKSKLRAFSASTESAFYHALPFPIAIVRRKIENAPNHTQRFSLLIELFEAVIRFLVLVLLADTMSGAESRDALTKVPDLARLARPSLGTWVSLLRSLSQIQSASSFLKEIGTLHLNEYQRTNEEFVNVRNQSFRGHGATLSESEYEQKFQEYEPSVTALVAKMAFLAEYRLVKTGSMEKGGDIYRISAQVLMGDNPVFETTVLSSRTPMDSQKVLYVNSFLEALVLDPYIVLEPCTECHRPELLLLDKFSDKKIMYLGYESGHKPSYANVDKLPLALRDLALKQSPRP